MSTTSYAEPSIPPRVPGIDRQKCTRNAAEQPIRCPGCAQMARVHPCFPNCDQPPIKYQVVRVCELRSDLHPLWHRDRRERWLPIVGFEGCYEVSDLGRVRSLERTVTRSDGRQQRIAERILNPRLQGGGHLLVKLWRDGSPDAAYVHRLVLTAFIGQCPEEMECLHWNDVPADNRLENLRWDSRSANLRDRVRNGRHNNANSSKSECPAGHRYSEENTYTATRGDGRKERHCRAVTVIGTAAVVPNANDKSRQLSSASWRVRE